MQLREVRPISQQRTTNGIATQRRNADDREDRPGADPDFPDVADLSDTRGQHAHERTRAESVQGSEDDDRGVGTAREPEGEDDDGGEKVHDDHDVEAAEAVPEVAGKGAAEDGEGVDDSEQVG